MKGFASDNYAGVHPNVLKAIEMANIDHAKAYGNDPYTKEAEKLFKAHFGEKIDLFFVSTGTAANVLGLQALLRPYEAVVCAESAHINVDECGAPEHFTGCKLLTIPTPDGKLRVEKIRSLLGNLGDPHKVQPKVISISQTTEWGTVYSPLEIKQIADFAHANNLYVHMDGARLCNAAASLKLSLAELTTDTGIDLLSFGGTKNGIMIGEAVIFFKKQSDFPFIRKQGMQLISKMRYIAAQFIALLKDDLWLKNAEKANAMANLLQRQVEIIPQIKITRPVEANALFAIIDPQIIPRIQERYPFYVWDEASSEVRWMTSWDTTEKDIFEFTAFLQQLFSN